MAFESSVSGGIQRSAALNGAPSINSPISMCAWFRQTSFATGGYTQLMGLFELGSGAGVALFHSSSSTMVATVEFGGVPVYATDPGTIATNTWVHVGLTWDGANVRLYINGTNVATTACTYSGGGAIDELGLALFMIGQCQDAMYWKRVLSTAELQAQMRRRVPLNPSGLFAWYPCHPGATERVRDYSGLANTASESGTTDTGENPGVAWGTNLGLRMWRPGATVVNLTGAGGIVSAGSASMSVLKGLAGTGGIQSSASATVDVGKELAGAGGIQSSASASVTVAKALAGDGGIRSAWDGALLNLIGLTGAGGIRSAWDGLLTGGTVGPVGGVKPRTNFKRRMMVLGRRRTIR